MFHYYIYILSILERMCHSFPPPTPWDAHPEVHWLSSCPDPPLDRRQLHTWTTSAIIVSYPKPVVTSVFHTQPYYLHITWIPIVLEVIIIIYLILIMCINICLNMCHSKKVLIPPWISSLLKQINYVSMKYHEICPHILKNKTYKLVKKKTFHMYLLVLPHKMALWHIALVLWIYTFTLHSRARHWMAIPGTVPDKKPESTTDQKHSQHQNPSLLNAECSVFKVRVFFSPCWDGVFMGVIKVMCTSFLLANMLDLLAFLKDLFIQCQGKCVQYYNIKHSHECRDTQRL